MNKLKILVVDDSFFMRKVLSDIINENDNFEVIGTARNGQEALQRIKDVNPDVVTMDIEMPIMDGLTALKIIMKEIPVPVLMLSGLTKEGADATIKALDLGAVDFIPKPGNIFKVNVDEMKDEIYKKINIAAKVKLKTKQQAMQQIVSSINDDKVEIPRVRKKISPQKVISKSSSIDKGKRSSKITKLVAIGTSTGGPRALQNVISDLPKDMDSPVVVVQHMPPSFTKSLAERLDSISNLRVKEAEDNDVLENGCVYIAPGGRHIKLEKKSNVYRIKLDDGPKVSGHKPSVDVMFSSVSEINELKICGVILTGMGSDGANGLCDLKKKQGYIIAQDEASCVVFGMPKSAINKGIVDKVVPLAEISKEIIDFVEVG